MNWQSRCLSLTAGMLLFVGVLSAQQNSAVHTTPGEFLRVLAGTWRFEVFDDQNETAVAQGEREMVSALDQSKLVWTERDETGAVLGMGFLGFDEARNTYYYVAAHAELTGPVLLIGRVVEPGGRILFSPVEVTPGHTTVSRNLVESELRVTDRNRFEWAATDGRWRVMFTRLAPKPPA